MLAGRGRWRFRDHGGEMPGDERADFLVSGWPPMAVDLPEIRRRENRPAIDRGNAKPCKAGPDAFRDHRWIGPAWKETLHAIVELGWRQEHGESARADGSSDPASRRLEQ